MNQTNTSQKAKQAKDKRTTAEDLGALQKNSESKVSKHLLYLRSKKPTRKQPSHWTHVRKGIARSFSKIRFTIIKTAVFCMQYPQRRNGCGLLRKNVKRNRARSDGTTAKGQASNRKGL